MPNFKKDNEFPKPEQPPDLMEEHTLKFLVDYMLGKLAKYLRMLGVDTVYFTELNVSKLIEKAYQEKIIISAAILSLNTLAGFRILFL